MFLIGNRLYLRLRQNFPGKQSLKPFSNPLFPKTVKLPLYFAVDLKIPFAQSKKSVAAKMQIVAVPHLLIIAFKVACFDETAFKLFAGFPYRFKYGVARGLVFKIPFFRKPARNKRQTFKPESIFKIRKHFKKVFE